jgi:hypothetical protein
MNVKIDTKEKFVVITPSDPDLTANMTEELSKMLLPYIQKDIPHLILNMSAIVNIDEQACEILANIQQEFYELEILEILNVTPTESEAWDIVQMEEIERELMGDID